MDINMPNDMIPSFDLSKITEGMPYDPNSPVGTSIMSQTPRSVLILGNGFDLDLGLNTRYEDFVNSDFWPFKRVSELDENSLTAHYIHSDVKSVGEFDSSNELFNKLWQAIRRGYLNNLHGIPTDCPQRDERLGWTGDAQVFFRTATFNRDVQNFFRKWLKDLAIDQDQTGRVSDIVPNLPGLVGRGRVGWADAATIIPWQHYMAYGDASILEEQYSSMKAWVDFVISDSDNYLWNKGWHYGDWLFYSVNNDNAGNSASIMAQTAEVLGRTDDARYYADVATKAREVFCQNYLTPAGMLVSSTQTAYVLALNFDMLPESEREKAAATSPQVSWVRPTSATF